MIVYPPYKLRQTAARITKKAPVAVFLASLLCFIAHRADAASVTLAWNPSSGSGIAGYHLYQGIATQVYTNDVDEGNVTNATVSGLVAGATYHFAVAAYGTDGLESSLSSEVTYTPSVTGTTPPTIALTSPAAGATYTAPASINLAATVVANGHTITKVQFLNGTTLLGEDTSAPYSLIWSNVNAGTYSLSAVLVYDTGSTLATAPLSVSVSAAPPPPALSLAAPWQTIDIGSPGLTGGASVSNGQFTVSGAGNINGAADNFRFVYQNLTSDGEIRAQISSVLNASSTGALGLMIRESLTPGAKYTMMGYSPSGVFSWQRRQDSGGGTSYATGNAAILPQVWVRLVRNGHIFKAFESIDGVNWTQVANANELMASNVYIGLAVASGTSSALATATFSDSTVIP